MFVTLGTSGGLSLILWSLVNPGDEVLMFDPYFVMYPALTKLVGGVPVIIDTYPDFRIDLNKVRDAITPRTKADPAQQPGQPDRRRRQRGRGPRPGANRQEKNVVLVSRRNLQLVLLRPAAGQPRARSTTARWSSTASARATA